MKKIYNNINEIRNRVEIAHKEELIKNLDMSNKGLLKCQKLKNLSIASAIFSGVAIISGISLMFHPSSNANLLGLCLQMGGILSGVISGHSIENHNYNLRKIREVKEVIEEELEFRQE